MQAARQASSSCMSVTRVVITLTPIAMHVRSQIWVLTRIWSGESDMFRVQGSVFLC